MSKKTPIDKKSFTVSSPPIEEPPTLRYPVVTVAQIAAPLLKDHEWNYRNAARAAIALLDACEGELTGRIDDPIEKQLKEAEAELKNYYDEVEQTIPAYSTFAQSAEIVTKLSPDGRAQKRFRLFLKHCIRYEKAVKATGKQLVFPESAGAIQIQYDQTPETSDEELHEMIRPVKFSRRQVHDWRVDYEKWNKQDKKRVASLNGKKGLGHPKKTSTVKKSFLPA